MPAPEIERNVIGRVSSLRYVDLEGEGRKGGREGGSGGGREGGREGEGRARDSKSESEIEREEREKTSLDQILYII